MFSVLAIKFDPFRSVSFVALGLQKDSEFREVFDNQILRMAQSGFLAQETMIWLRERRSELVRSPFVEEATAMSLENLFFPMIVMAAGVGVSLVIFVVEKWRLHVPNLARPA